MTYLKIFDGSPQPYSLAQARREILSEGVSIRRLEDIPEADREALLAARGIYRYTEAERPAFNRLTQTVTQGPFEQAADGSWSRGWVVADIPEAKREAAAQAEADSFEIPGGDIDQLKALVDVMLELDQRNRDGLAPPTTDQARNALKSRILFYARRRRGLS